MDNFTKIINCADSVRDAHPLFQAESGGAVPTSALDLKVVEINIHLACQLNNVWHSRLPIIRWSNVVRNTHYICYGAGFDGKWYAVGIWSTPIAANRLKDGKKNLS